MKTMLRPPFASSMSSCLGLGASEGLSQEYLTFFYIQQLSELGEGNVVYVPTEGGIPLIRNLGAR